MDFRNYVEASIQVDGIVFTMLMPAGSTFKAAHTACMEMAKNIEQMALKQEEFEKAKADQAKAEAYNKEQAEKVAQPAPETAQ